MLDPYWNAARQFQRDRGDDSPFGLIGAVFVATGVNGVHYEHEADLDIHPPAETPPSGPLVGPTIEDALVGRPVRQPWADAAAGVLYGVQFLCPRCHMACYVPTRHHPAPRTNPRDVHVHWDKPLRSETDGKLRPTFTIDGKLECDYLQSEVTGIVSPTGMRCGWMGVIEEGKVYEHSLVRGDLRRFGA